MKNFVHTLDDQKFGAGIIIYSTSLTSQASKIISTIAGQFRIEAFPESELMVNITHHELVPRHIVMTTEEKKELLARYRLKETQLPRIQLADPVARYYGLEGGRWSRLFGKVRLQEDMLVIGFVCREVRSMANILQQEIANTEFGLHYKSRYTKLSF